MVDCEDLAFTLREMGSQCTVLTKRITGVLTVNCSLSDRENNLPNPFVLKLVSQVWCRKLLTLALSNCDILSLLGVA